VDLTVEPEEGKANKQVIKELDLPKSAINTIRGKNKPGQSHRPATTRDDYGKKRPVTGLVFQIWVESARNLWRLTSPHI